jgi:DNA-binding MarR family transcriptional regulator
MSLETDIQQQTFRSEYQKALLNILFTSNYLIAIVNDFFKPYDITRQQYNVMRIVKGQLPKAASIQLIRDRMLDKMSDASRIVERLRLKNMVKREISPDDKRIVHISITDEGIKLLDSIEMHVEEMEKSMKNLSREEAVQLNKLLDKIRG